MKQMLIAFMALVLVGAGVYFFTRSTPDAGDTTGGVVTTAGVVTTQPTTTEAVEDKTQTIIGKSVESRDIVAYHFGAGPKEVLFVGGVHGGYGWNTALVAFDLVEYLKQHPEVVPANVKVTVIPVLNPDGLQRVVGTTTRFLASDVAASQVVQTSGRFNAKEVDLNRNFDCDWQASGTWQKQKVSGGSSAFSEPESAAFKQYIETHNPAAVVAWFSAAGGVFSSNCHTGVSSETSALTKVYAKASGYPAHEDFDFYAVTGDVTNWLAKMKVPAISVLLTNHTDTEWDKNLAGVTATLKYFAE